MKKITLVFMLLAIAATGQNRKLGKVTVAELSEKVHPLDSTAAAAILFKTADVYFQITSEGYWNVISETNVKIKIYKKEGYRFADVEEVFYAGNNSDNVKFYDQATYNLVDGKVEKTKIKNESIFTEQKSKDFKSKKLTFSNVKEGSVIEYTVTKTSYGLTSLDDFYFQYDIPVNFIEYRVKTPEYFDYNRMIGGYLQPQRKDETFNVHDGFDESRTTFWMTNVKAMKDEDYVNNIDNYRSRMIYELSSKNDGKGMVENYATSWAAVTDKIYDNDDFGRELEKNAYFEDDVNAIVSGLTTKSDKVNAVFNFVRERMTWNEYNGYSCQDGVRAAYKNKSGNVAEINLMLTAMLRHLGMDANPVLVSTRSNGIAIFPSRTAFNYIICAVEGDNEIILLDATTKYNQPNILPVRVLNGVGRVIRRDGTSAEVNLTPMSHSKEVITVIAAINSEGIVSGKTKDQYFDYNSYRFRENYGILTKESYLEKLEGKFKGISIDTYEVQNDKEVSLPYIENYSFTHENLVEIIGDKMYFSPMLFFATLENPFKQDAREFPVDFIYPHNDKYSINIEIPAGYKIESLPLPHLFSMEENLGSFKYNISAQGQKVQLAVVYEINTAIVGPQYYETLKLFFKEMISKQNEKIVLKKV